MDANTKSSENQPSFAQVEGSHVFISYSRQDSEVIQVIRKSLEDLGHSVWQDTTAIAGGTEWVDSIEKGIKDAYAVITVVSRNANASKWVRLEFLEAQRRGKRIIPIKIDDCELPITMLDIMVTQAHPNFQSGLNRLLALLPLNTKLAQVGEISPAQQARQMELDYLDHLILEFSVWQTVYTPMAGVARIRQYPEKTDIKRSVANIDPKFVKLHQQIQTSFADTTQISAYQIEDISLLLNQSRQIVILGDPGAGKTTTLWKLAAELAENARQDPSAPLPVILRLGALPSDTSVLRQLQNQLGDISFRRLITQGRIALLIDALNELPAENRTVKIRSLVKLVKLAIHLSSSINHNGILIAITCRELDYKGELDLNIPEQIRITPLDALRIWQFCVNYLPNDGNSLFWELLGDQGNEIRDYWNIWKQEKGSDFSDMWLNSGHRVIQEIDEMMTDGRNSRSMLALARNPYMLFMMTEVYSETAKLPRNRGKLFELFTNFLLSEREKLNPEAVYKLKTQLSLLSFSMQQDKTGTTIPRSRVHDFLSANMLYDSLRANILNGENEIRFSHQLLQEYFAALKVDIEMRGGIPATKFWPLNTWWQPQGWEETIILLAGLYNDDLSPVIDWWSTPSLME
ncbi:MAG: TIR domain-containing protein [Chloroflexi bacterium]|nr:TIR domain-containing protein [Chloroflexota bacterium]